MPDVDIQLRDYFEATTPSVEKQMEQILAEVSPARRWWWRSRLRGPAVAVAAALAVIVLVGGLALLIRWLQPEEPVVDEDTTTTTIPGPPVEGLSINTIGSADTELVVPLSVALPPDGLPVIVYSLGAETGQGSVMVAKCSDLACSSVTPITIDAVSSADIAMALAANGLPILAVNSRNTGEATSEDEIVETASLLFCGDSSCSTTSAVELGEAEVSSIAVGSDGLPVVGLSRQGDVTLIKCDVADCTQFSSQVIDTQWGWSVNVSIGNDGLPILAYQKGSQILVAKCSDPTCASPATITPVADINIEGLSLEIAPDGSPLIGFMLRSPVDDGGLVGVIRCGDPACADPALTSQVTLAEDEVAGTPAIGFGTDGTPLVAYAGREIHLVTCGFETCGGGNRIASIEAADAWTGEGLASRVALAIAADGRPLLVYKSGGELRVAYCGDETCDAVEMLELPGLDTGEPVETASGAWRIIPPEEAGFGGELGFNAVVETPAGLLAAGGGCIGEDGCGPGAFISLDGGELWNLAFHEGDPSGGGGISSAAGYGNTVVMVGNFEEWDPDSDTLTVFEGAWIISSDGSLERVPLYEVSGPAEETAEEIHAIVILDVAASELGFVAVGADSSGALAWHSADGLSWDSIDLESEPGTASSAVLPTDAGFVALGSSWMEDHSLLRVWESADGRAWTPVDADFGIGEDNAWIGDVAWDGTTYVAVGGGCTANWEECWSGTWTSMDAASWTFHPGLELSRVAATPYGFVAFGSDPETDASGVWTSADGEEWTLEPDPNSIFDNSLLMAIGSTSDGAIIIGNKAAPGAAEAITTAWIWSPDS